MVNAHQVRWRDHSVLVLSKNFLTVPNLNIDCCYVAICVMWPYSSLLSHIAGAFECLAT
jgi:hypothetical protein